MMRFLSINLADFEVAAWFHLDDWVVQTQSATASSGPRIAYCADTRQSYQRISRPAPAVSVA